MDYGDEVDFNKCRDYFKDKLPKGKNSRLCPNADIIGVPNVTINSTEFLFRLESPSIKTLLIEEFILSLFYLLVQQSTYSYSTKTNDI